MTTVANLFALAQRQHQSGNAQAAAQLYRNILEAEPQHADALHFLGVLYSQSGRHDLALPYMEQARSLRPQAPHFHANLALVYQASGQGETAIALLRQALRLKPDYVDAHYNLGALLEAAGRLEEARASYQDALRFRPDYGEALVNLGNVERALGRPEEAAACYRRALALPPAAVQAHLNLGTLLQEQGQAVDARACYEQALQSSPACAEAHNGLGTVWYHEDRLSEAVASYRQAIALKPDFAQAHNNLGIAFSKLGRLDEALASCREALRLRPDDPELHNNLGNVLEAQENLDEAIACYQQALRLRPNYAEALTNLGTALKFQGRLDEAVRCYQRALEVNPNLAGVYFNLSELASKGRYQFTGTDVERVRRLLEAGKLSLHEQTLLHFCLGGVLAKAAVFAEAFEQYRQANDCQRLLLAQRGEQFQPEAHARAVDQLAQAFDRSYFQRVRGLGSDWEAPVFIVGMPRSGTTLVEQILSSHPQVFGAGERPEIDQIVQGLARTLGGAEPYPACLARLDRATVQSLARFYQERLTARSGGSARVVDKEPHNWAHLGIIATLFPQARVIHCCRDPLDTCLACYFQRFEVAKSFTSSLESLGLYYRTYAQLMAHWRAVLPIPIFEVCYEDLVQDQEKVSRELVSFCGLDWDEGCLDFHQNSRPVLTASAVQVRQPIYHDSIGRWKKYRDFLGPLRAALGDLPKG